MGLYLILHQGQRSLRWWVQIPNILRFLLTPISSWKFWHFPSQMLPDLTLFFRCWIAPPLLSFFFLSLSLPLSSPSSVFLRHLCERTIHLWMREDLSGSRVWRWKSLSSRNKKNKFLRFFARTLRSSNSFLPFSRSKEAKEEEEEENLAKQELVIGCNNNRIEFHKIGKKYHFSTHEEQNCDFCELVDQGCSFFVWFVATEMSAPSVSAANCPATKRRSTDQVVGSPFRDCSCSVAWVRSRDGKVPADAVVAGSRI